LKRHLRQISTLLIIALSLPVSPVRAEEASCSNPHLKKGLTDLYRRSAELEKEIAKLQPTSHRIGAIVKSEEKSARRSQLANYSAYSLAAGIILTQLPSMVAGTALLRGSAGALGAAKVAGQAAAKNGSVQAVTTVKQMVGAGIGVVSISSVMDDSIAGRFGDTFLISLKGHFPSHGLPRSLDSGRCDRCGE
jgi:hypothetical protein